MGFENGVGALLLGQSDTGDAEAAVIAEACETAGATYVAVSNDADQVELLLGARRMATPCVERLGTVLIEDVGVPIPRIPHLIVAVQAIVERQATSIPVVGHAGDGNLHPLVTFDSGDPDAVTRAEQAFDNVMDAALALGGTVNSKARHLMSQLEPDAVDVHHQIKDALDPLGLLNPGKWV